MAKEGGRRVWESQLSKTLEFLKSLPTRFPISHSEPLQEIMYVLFYHPEAEVSSHRLRCCKCCPEKHAVWVGRQQIPFYPLQLLHMLKFLKEKAVVTSSDARTGNLSPSSHCHRYSLLPIRHILSNMTVLRSTWCAWTISSSGTSFFLHPFGGFFMRQSNPPDVNNQLLIDLCKSLKCCACVPANGLLAWRQKCHLRDLTCHLF